MYPKVKNSGALWNIILLIWAAGFSIILITIRVQLIDTNPALTIFFALVLGYFFLVGVFNLVVNIQSRILDHSLKGTPLKSLPRVALFYLTYNDFEKGSASSMLRSNYPNQEIWILDDSTNTASITAIDQFISSSSQSIQLVRRPTRSGFKAGAINNALKTLNPLVKYVAILDSDEYIPPAFVERNLAFFGDKTAFVQSTHRCYNKNESWFTDMMGIGVDLHWRHYQPYRNSYGTPNMLGHGALVSRKVLDEVGGFPEITCEDLGFTVEARLRGYRGVFSSNVVCGESFPSDFSAMRRRHLRWSWSTMEFLRKYAGRVLRSDIGVHEKLDIMLPSLNLPAALIFLIFLVTLSAAGFLGIRVPLMQTPSIAFVSIISSFAPLLMFSELISRPLMLLRVIVVNTVAFLALFTSSIKGALKGLVQPAQFLVTPKSIVGKTLGRSIIESWPEVTLGLMLELMGFIGSEFYGFFSLLALSSMLTPLLIYFSAKIIKT
jgi:cellulose synthase/poly-beta-1,6-N-acetylglucosamine synthase-like glycosyltransferase